MARSSRLASSTGIYHVMMRGINHSNIFRDNLDKVEFLKILKGILSRRACISGNDAGAYEVYAYALMGNHFHLLLKVASGNLGDFVKALASGYALYFNKKYNRDGHLFKERFKSEPCETKEYFTTLLRYIHQNPIKAGFADNLLEYKYTSWHEYADPDNFPLRICSVEDVLSKYPLEELEKKIYSLLQEGEYRQCLDMDKKPGNVSDSYVLGLIRTFQRETGNEDLLQLNKAQRKEMIVRLLNIGASVCQIERLTGISKATVSRVKANLAKNETK